jgi:hypothetical protein
MLATNEIIDVRAFEIDGDPYTRKGLVQSTNVISGDRIYNVRTVNIGINGMAVQSATPMTFRSLCSLQVMVPSRHGEPRMIFAVAKVVYSLQTECGSVYLQGLQFVGISESAQALIAEYIDAY